MPIEDREIDARGREEDAGIPDFPTAGVIVLMAFGMAFVLLGTKRRSLEVLLLGTGIFNIGVGIIFERLGISCSRR